MAKVSVNIDEKYFDAAARAEVRSLKSKLQSSEGKLARRDKRIIELETLIRESIVNTDAENMNDLRHKMFMVVQKMNEMNLVDAGNFCTDDHFDPDDW